MRSSTVPDGMPLLSRGRHRTPRHGASLMEATSLLAGEPWSDRPACTHPLLTQLARLVNDHTTDAGRQDLALLAPALVGRRGDDDTWLRLAVAVAATTILEVPEATQRALAVGLVRAERLSADAGPALAATRREARAALALVPGSVAWAERLGVRTLDPDAFAEHTAPTMVRCAVEGIVATESPDRDRRLRTVLEAGLDVCPPDRADRPAPGF